jgi:dihydropteroate synthase
MGQEYDQHAEGILEATVAFNAMAAWMGVHVARVHDVREVADAVKVVNAIRSGHVG